MKFSADRKALSGALKIVSVAVGARSTLPILGSVLLNAEGGKLILSTTDLDLFVTTEIDAQVETMGAVVAPFGLLSALIERLQDSRVSFNSGQKVLSVTCGEVVANFETLPADEFPADFAKDGAETVECDASDITKPFARIESFISKDPSRYTLMGINLAPGKRGTDFTATTGTKLATYRGEKICESNVIVSDVFVRALLKIQPKGATMLSISEGVISITSGPTTLSGKLIEGTYPNYRQAIPANGSNIFGLNRAELTNAIKTCSLFLVDREIGLTVQGKGKHAEVSASSKAKATILGSELSGQPDFSIRFNYQHMLSTLAVLENEDVRLQCSDDKTPMKIEEGPFLAVLVPVAPL